ncbi:hypothetical protein RB213_014639, partial [Colletotrichum asianum]
SGASPSSGIQCFFRPGSNDDVASSQEETPTSGTPQKKHPRPLTFLRLLLGSVCCKPFAYYGAFHQIHSRTKRRGLTSSARQGHQYKVLRSFSTQRTQPSTPSHLHRPAGYQSRLTPAPSAGTKHFLLGAPLGSAPLNPVQSGHKRRSRSLARRTLNCAPFRRLGTSHLDTRCAKVNAEFFSEE